MALFERKKDSVTITPKIMKMNGASPATEYDGVPNETLHQKRTRKRSHWVIYCNTLVMAIGFSIIITGAWPYLLQLSPDSTKEFLGWVIAVNPLGQMISSPLLGIWANKSGSTRGAFFATILLYIIGNTIYATLSFFGSYAKIMMLISRFIIGLSSGNVTLCRSYIAHSTTIRERTTAVSIIAGAMSFGVIIGPGIQTALALAFEDDIPSNTSSWVASNSTDSQEDYAPSYSLNVYNTTGWVSVALGCINLLLFMPCIFKEFTIDERKKSIANIKYPKPDYTAIFSLLIPFFFVFFVNVLIETILVPLCIDMYAWKPVVAVKYAGIGLSIAAAITLILFMLSGKISKLISDKRIVFFLGVIPLTVGLLIFIPMGSTFPKIRNCTSEVSINEDIDFTTMATNINETDSTHLTRHKRHVGHLNLQCDDTGCPPEQTWCYDTPIVEIPQLIIASLFIVIGYPFIFGVTGAIYSKMLGPKPQGLWMGLLTSTGSLSRMTGPLFVSYMYTDLGPQWTFGSLFGLSVIVFIITAYFYKRFVPMDLSEAEHREQLQT